MFDLASKSTYLSVPRWYESISSKKISIVILGNKYDISTMKQKNINFHCKKSLQCYNISAKNVYHFDKPFLYLIKKFMGDDTHLIETPQ